jgi:hypothetical protein
LAAELAAFDVPIFDVNGRAEGEIVAEIPVDINASALGEDPAFDNALALDDDMANSEWSDIDCVGQTNTVTNPTSAVAAATTMIRFALLVAPFFRRCVWPHGGSVTSAPAGETTGGEDATRAAAAMGYVPVG